MDQKKVILIVAALLIAVVTAVMAKNLFSGSATPQVTAQDKKPSGPQVLVATRALPVGTIVTQDAYRFQPWPKELVEEAYFIQGAKDFDPALLPGTVVRHALTAGEPITKGALVAPGDRGFLAAALTPGMRAVTVPVSALTGVAGFIFPGDRVDLVLTQKVSGVEGPDLKVAETIIRNLRVLATDQRVEAKKNEEGQTVAVKTKLVTMEATPRIAEKITVAQTIGTISLSLRSLSDSAGELESAIASGEMDMPKGVSPEEEEKLLKQMAQRPIDGKSTFATGGDVSRFQRSSIPPQTQKQVEKAKGPTVRISRAGSTSEIEFTK